tara:strand:- start:6750 stop:7901 length:1152 start_codon:yes stop_codon:yes gene_type:complete
MASQVPNIWPGSASFFPGDTPFGLYDSDSVFQADTEKVADWCAKRLGYPLVDIEMQQESFFACFEESVSEYSAQVNYQNIKDNIFTLKGESTASNLTHRNITPTQNNIVRLSDTYGTEAGAGGTVSWKRTSIAVTSNSQTYDLNELVADVSESGKAITIKRISYEAKPAISRYFDPYLGTGNNSEQFLDGFGWGNMSPAINYVMMPIYADLLRVQAIEFNDTIRKSSYSFEIINNQLRLFPIPDTNYNLWLEYVVDNDTSPISGSSGIGNISDFSNIPYNTMTYSQINEAGKQWVRKYTFALSKELLGIIRSKYGSIPIPGGDVSLDGDTLRSEAATEKDALVERLREDLEQTSRRNTMEREKEIAEFQQETLGRNPYPIYVA